MSAEPEPGLGAGLRWPSPIGDRRWTGADGTRWRMRGGVLTPREVRRLLKRPGVRVLHVYGVEPREVEGGAADELLAHLMAFFDGEAARFTSFRVADFRNDDRRIMLVVEQSC